MSKKDIALTTTKALLGVIPYFGTALNETIFEHRSRVKQNRINSFIQDLSEYIDSLNIKNPSIEHITTDEFGDVFEAIIRKVSESSNQAKVERFKIILANQIVSPSKLDFMDTYIDIVSKLNEKQILILQAHENIIDDLEKVELEITEKQSELSESESLVEELKTKAENGTITINESIKESMQKKADIQSELIEYKQKSDQIQSVRNAEYYNLEDGEFLFCKQDLISKALLKESGAGTLGFVPYRYMMITEFGRGLLSFIKTK